MKPIVKRIRQEEILPQKRAYEIVLPAAVIFVGVMLSILLFGITMLYSTSFGTNGTTYFSKQLMWTVVGFIGFFTAVLFGYKRVSDWSPWLILCICVLLLIADFSSSVKGAQRWIKIPHVGNIQPSEYAKLVVSLFLAKFLSDRAKYIETSPFMKVYVPCILLCGIPLGLVLLGEDLGTTVLLTLIVCSAMFVSGIRLS